MNNKNLNLIKNRFLERIEIFLQVKITWFNFSYSILFILGLSFVLNLGASLQHTTLGLLTGPEVDIYRSEYGANLIKFTSLNDWLFNLTLFFMFPIAIGLLLVLRKQKKAREIFLISSVYLFCALSVLDLIFIFWSEDQSITKNFFPNVISNLVGAPLLAIYVVIVGRISEIIIKFTPNLRRIRQSIALVFAITAGLVLSIFFHQIYSLFFDPKQIKIQAVAYSPIDGFLNAESVAEKSNISTAKDEDLSGFFQKKTVVSNLAYVLTENAKFDWENKFPEFKYKIEIYLYSGCIPSEIEAFSRKDKPIFVNNDLRAMNIGFGDRLEQITFPASESNSMQMKNNANSFFWMRKSKKDDHVNYVQFLENLNINFGNKKEPIEVVAALMLIDKEQKNFLPSSKEEKIEISINGKNQDLTIRNKNQIDLNSKIKCTSIKIDQKTPNKLEFKDINVGALLRILILPVPDLNKRIDRVFPELSISSEKNSYLRVDDVSNQEVSDYFNNGRFSAFSIRGKFKELKVNDQKTEVGEIEELGLSDAKLEVKISQTGEFLVDGIAQAAHRNAERVNQTRWERLDASIKLLLLSGIFGLVSTIFVFLSKCLSSNSRVRI